RREALIRDAICEVRCRRETELHLTLPAREAPLKAAPRQKASDARLCTSRWKSTEPHISFRRTPIAPYRHGPENCLVAHFLRDGKKSRGPRHEHHQTSVAASAGRYIPPAYGCRIRCPGRRRKGQWSP